MSIEHEQETMVAQQELDFIFVVSRTLSADIYILLVRRNEKCLKIETRIIIVIIVVQQDGDVILRMARPLVAETDIPKVQQIENILVIHKQLNI